MQTKLLFVLAILSVLVTGAAPAKEFKPGVISLGSPRAESTGRGTNTMPAS